MKLGLLQLNSTIGDFAGNIERLLAGYRRACAEGAELVLAPEMFLCGYPPRDLLLRPDFVERNLAARDQVAAATGAVPLLAGYVDRNTQRPGRPLLNALAWCAEGRVVHRTFKGLLPTYDVFDEDRYFEPGETNAPFQIGSHLVGLTICEDIWNDQDFWPERRYRRDPVRDLIDRGATLILNLAASPWHRGKEETRREMLRTVARDERVPLAMVNLVGGNDELIFDGHSVFLDAQGRVIRQLPGFTEAIEVVDTESPAAEPGPGWAEADGLLADGLALGVRDYVRKCGFREVIIGLSGGIDSAVVAALAVRALGPECVLGVSMPSPYSSEGSRTDAAALARHLGIRLETVPIAGPMAALERELAPLFAGRPADATEENIQSRLRGNILMSLSNKWGALVLTTGNKSEMAVGYCTLYGDMCGALAVIADVLKTEVYELAAWLNREAGQPLIPEASIAKPPSAELRPNQKDEDSLPPYAILDRILADYVVHERSAEEIVSSGFDPLLVRDVINKVTFSEYKRRQAAPGLKVSPRAFGMGRRVPIAQRFRA
jgi:NAD+ synthase (glutamine-hydrolysing)